MNEEKAYATPNPPTPGRPVIFNTDLCTGCNRCVEVCMTDIFIPNPEKGKPPIIIYPEECWYGGVCVDHCPVEGAITLNHPLMQRAHFKRKDTGEHFWV
jgi:NAD-dependent dihydropyrimidine dehydrogenase PreA subunit